MMAEPAFSPAMERALDSYVVPPVPTGFADRLMTRIASGNTVNTFAATKAPDSWSRRASPWRRTSRIVGSFAFFAFGAAAAAAGGMFGEPVYMPGISEVLVKANIVAAPSPASPAKARKFVQRGPSADSGVATTMQSPTGSVAIVDRVAELRADPDFAKLPPRQRMAVTVKEVRRMVRSGEASRQDARAAVRTLAQEADPETRAAWRKMAAMRRDQRLARAVHAKAAAPIAPAGPVGEALNAPVPPSDPEVAAKDIAADREIDLSSIEPPKLTPERVAALRERLRHATPEQRAAIKAALRERRQILQRRRPR